MNRKGFTLIELLIVIAILGILAAAILVAVDPVGRIQEARDARRWSETNAILNAVLNKQVDARDIYHGTTGTIAPIITSANPQVIVIDEPGVGACTAEGTKPVCPGKTLSDLTEDCVARLSDLAPTYIAQIPTDPGGATPATGPAIGSTNTGYYIHRTTGNRIEVGACYPERGTPISVRR